MEYITLDREQQTRADVLTRLLAGALTTGEAANSLDLSVRQVERLRPAFRDRGLVALVHGNAGRAPANRLSKATRSLVLDLAKVKYKGFNFEHLTDMLEEEEGITASADTVRRICLEGGRPSPVPEHRRKQRRRRRPRCEQAGEMLQMDGTKEDFLEGRGGQGVKLTLVNAIDDATGWKWATFDEEETLEGYMTVLRQVILDRGVPLMAYTDGISTVRGGASRYKPHFDPGQSHAQLRRAFQELGMTVVVAKSAQAKGRVERTNGLDQDRLTSMLRLAEADSLESARLVLPKYLRHANRRFSVTPVNPVPAWRPRPATPLDDILCRKEVRTVGGDNTVQVYGVVIDIPAGSPRRDYAGRQVQIHRRFDNSVGVYYDGQRIAGTPPIRRS